MVNCPSPVYIQLLFSPLSLPTSRNHILLNTLMSVPQSCPIKAAAGSHTARALGIILRVLKDLFIDFLWLLLHWSSLSLLDRPEITYIWQFCFFHHF